MEERRVWDESQLRKYDIPLDYVPKYPFDDPRVNELIAANRPVIMTGSHLVGPAEKWDLDYLSDEMKKTPCTVIVSKDHRFKYHDDRACKSHLKPKGFVPPTKRTTMKISEFSNLLRTHTGQRERVYLQQTLNSSVGPGIVQDFLGFRWEWVKDLHKSMSWGPLTSNLLLIAMEGNVTPCHYDEQHNLFAQIRGFKRFILFAPEQFDCLYPYPVYHPHDRQSQVEFEAPDFSKFPRFAEARGSEAVIGPGDVLYIPLYWWHHVESLLRGGYTISVNFWYKAGPTEKVEYPLKDHQKVAIMRNVEKMLVEAVRDPKDLTSMLSALVLGRYTRAH